MRIDILIAPKVPLYLRETLRRCGFTVWRIGSDFGMRIGQTWLGCDEVIVRIIFEEPQPRDTE